MSLAPFRSSANSPNIAHVTKHGGNTRENGKNNSFGKFVPQRLEGTCCVRDTVLGGTGYNGEHRSRRPDPSVLTTAPKGSSHQESGGRSSPRGQLSCVTWVFIPAFQNNNISE